MRAFSSGEIIVVEVLNWKESKSLSALDLRRDRREKDFGLTPDVNTVVRV